MKIIEFDKDESGIDRWHTYRQGKITGTKLKEVVPKTRGEGKRAGFYDLLAERIAIPANQENVMDRGKRLEDTAIEKFELIKKVEVDKRLLIICRDDNEDIAISPDGLIWKKIKGKKVVKEALDVKCLASGRHIEAFVTGKIPSEYEFQVLQYFICIDTLEKFYLVFYDNRMPKDLFWLEVNRKDIQEKVDEYLEMEKKLLDEIKILEDKLTF